MSLKSSCALDAYSSVNAVAWPIEQLLLQSIETQQQATLGAAAD